MEHSGGEKWSIIHGDTLQVIKSFQPKTFDALITDPPYASGGWKPSEKNRTTSQKYSSMAFRRQESLQAGGPCLPVH